MCKYKKDLVSIIIPVYNVEKFIDKCLFSVVNQTYTNLEIIIVDDGSPDNCPKICDAWQKKDQRIKVIHKKNGGLSDARNVGLLEATGEYILFIDSDDYISMNMIDDMLKMLLKKHADMVICQYVDAYPNGDMWTWKHDMGTKILTAEEALYELFRGRNITNHVWRKLLKHELIPNNLFPINKNYEDIYVVVDLFLACKKIVYLPNVYYYYLSNPKGIVNTVTEKNCLDHRENRNRCYAQALEVYPQLADIVKQTKKRFDKKISYQLREVRLRNKPVLHNVLIKTRKICEKFNRIYKSLLLDIRIIKKIVSTSRPRIYIVGTPNSGNLSDQAIYVGEVKFIRDFFPDYTMINLPFNHLRKSVLFIVHFFMSSKDYLAIHGETNEKYHKKYGRILKKFKKHKIIIFPQTFNKQNNIFLQTKDAYERCEHLILALREKKSYELIKKNMPIVKSILVPDMTIYLNASGKQQERKDVLVSLRKDDELFDLEYYMDIMAKIKERFSTFIDSDMHAYYDINNDKEEGRRYLDSFLKQLYETKIIITNREQLMLLAAITKTPCVVLANNDVNDWKIYDWLKNLDYLKIISNIEDFDNALDQVQATKNLDNKLDTENYFNDFAAAIKKI